MTPEKPAARPPGAPPPDQDQRDLILASLDRSMLVEAAAGTGKTASMVGRMVALLRTGTCGNIRSLAAVTFTRKAAAELRARFQVDLERAAREAEGEERARLERALGDIEHCFCGTIHSFCGRLLRERPVEAGVDLSFTEMDEEDDRRLREEAWGELVSRLMARDPEGILSGLFEVGLRPDQLAAAFLRFAGYPDVDEWPLPADGAPLPPLGPVRTQLEAYLEHMRRLAPRLPADPGTDKLIPLYRRLPRIASHYDDLDRPDLLMEMLARFDAKPYFAMANWTRGVFTDEEAKTERSRWQDFRDGVARPMLQAWREHRYLPVMRVLLAARDLYDLMRAERGCLNFQDLLMRAAALLRGRPHVRRYFARRFTHLLVDEFQDTDPIQAEVMLLLTAADPEERDWRKCRPRPGSLFVVGDPKQSIYRFRRADIVTYNEVKEILLADGAPARLSANFRSTGSVIDWVNGVFEPDGGAVPSPDEPMLRFPGEDRPESPAYVPLQKGRPDEDSGSFSGVTPLRIPEGLNMDDSVACEADRIARTIRCALDRGLTVARTARQLEQGASENVDPSDFMIVTRRNRNLGVYARALQKYGIPHRVSGGSALNEVDELKLLYLCVRALARPDDPVALLAVLRSELFGLSDAALFSFKRAGGRFSFHSEVPEEAGVEAAEPLRDAFSRLRRYQSWMSRLPVPAALERITADLGLAVLAAAREGGEVQAGSLCKALEVLRSAQSGMWSLAQLEEYLGRLVEAEERYDGVSALSGDRPAVRVMNLHRVKGLESPVVFLADPGGDKEHPVELHVDRSGPRTLGYMAVWGEARGWGGAPLLACPTDWKRAEGRERAFVNAENLRLRYVAATRACCALVITQREAKGRDTSPWRWFLPFLNAAGLPDPGPQAAPVEPTAPLDSGEADGARSGIAGRLARCESPTYDVRAAKEYALSHPELFPPRGDTGDTGEAVAEAADGVAGAGEGEHGLEWGSVIHLLLEAAAREPASDLEALAAAALSETGQDASLAKAAADLVRSVMSSEVWRRSLAAARRLTEVPFHYLLDEDIAGLPTLLRGSVDLAFEEDGGWVLVDYKSDLASGAGQAEALGRRYAPQLRLYARAWEACTGEPVRETLLYFIRPAVLLAV